jgi:Kef-type K+ transport system membrane component KefB
MTFLTDSLFAPLSVLLMSGMLFGRIAKKIKIPSFIGYLIAGLLLGSSMFNILTDSMVESLSFVSSLALLLIAFSIGSQFKISYFKQVGIAPIVVAFLEALIAYVFVTVGFLLLGASLAFALVIGAISSATAPAATVMVIKEYKAKGPFTDLLLSVVAIDDAVALMLFGINAAIANVLIQGTSFNVLALFEPLKEIGVSLLVGVLCGLFLAYLMRFFKSRANRYSLAVTVLLFGAALATSLNASSLLLIMALSATFANLSPHFELVAELVERSAPPLFILFFVLTGTHLNIWILPSIGVFGIVYIIMRQIGKSIGSYLGVSLMKLPKLQGKYLGYALAPQGGVAIGLTYVAQTIVPMYANTIQVLILSTVLILELFGPLLARYALKQVQEI